MKQHLRDHFQNFAFFSRNTRLFLCGTFFVGLAMGTFWVLLNLYLKELGYSEGAIGRVITIASTGTFFISIPAAMAIDRFPARKILISAAVLASLGYAGQVFSHTFGGILVAAALAGAAFAVHNVTAAPFFMRNSTSRERLDLFGAHAAIEILAGVVGAAGGGALPRLVVRLGGSLVDGYRLTLALAAACVLLAIVPYLLIREPRRDGAALRFVDYFRARDWKLLTKIAFPKFMTGLGAGLVIPFLNLYFRDRFRLNSNVIGVIFALSQLLTTIGFLTGPALARRFGMIRAAVATELLSTPFFLVLAFTHHVWLAVGAFWFRGALMNMNQPISDNFAMEMVGRDQHAVANSVNMMTWNAAWMISAQLGGDLIERHGFTPPMLVTVSLYIAASLTYLALFRDAERRVIEPRRRKEMEMAARQPAAASAPGLATEPVHE